MSQRGGLTTTSTGMVLVGTDVPIKYVSINFQHGCAPDQHARWVLSKLRVDRLLIAAALLFAPLLNATAVAAQEIDSNREYNLKSVFLYSFGRYMTWDTPAANAGDFEIGVLGPSPIVDKLRQIATKRNLNGRALKISVAATADELQGCHILFISRDVPDEMVARLAVAPSTIVVGERANLLNMGASAIFFIDGTSVRFELNRKNLAKKEIQVDAKLLSLSRTRR